MSWYSNKGTKDEFFDWLDGQIEVALDIETVEDVIIGIGVGTPERLLYASKGDCFEMMGGITRHVQMYNRRLIMHNGRSDIKGMRAAFPFTHWPRAEWNLWDTMVAANVLQYQDIDLNTMSWEVLGHGVTHESFSALTKLYKCKDLEGVPEEVIAEYNLSQVANTFGIYQGLSPRIYQDEKLTTVFNLEMNVSPILLQMEENGILIDAPRLANLRERYALEGATYQDVVATLTHGGIQNVNSPQQVREYLFEVLQHPIIYKTKSGKGSTDERVLKKIAAGKYSDDPRYKWIRPLLHARQTLKLVGTYCDGIAASLDSGGRTHTQLSQTTADTGRLASREPNHQNIPKRRGPEIRRCFVAPEGCVLVAADMDQLELRILAEEAKEPKMVDAFLNNRDIHQEVADELGLARFPAKILNYTIVYMAGPQQIADQIGVSKAKAEMWQTAYFRKYHVLNQWMKDYAAFCKERGYTETWLGRKRDVVEFFVPKKNYTGGTYKNSDMGEGARKSVNTRIQGTAAEIVKLAMLRVESKLRYHKLQSRQLLQIHDELLLEVPVGELALVTAILTREMSTHHGQMPLPCTVKVGANWGDVH